MMHHVQDRYWYTYGPNEPSVQLKPGDVVTVETVDGANFDREGNKLPDDKRHHGERGTLYEGVPLVGPFCVDGAEEGDALAVTLESIRLNRDTAWCTVLPHTVEGRSGALMLEGRTPSRRLTWQLDHDRNVACTTLEASGGRRVEIPMRPFLGSIGVAPRYGAVQPALYCGEFGGNMDSPEMRAGTTVYFPVFARGGYLGFGDMHAAQGEGEICALEWPRAEDDEFLISIVNARPLDEAFRRAHFELVRWMTELGFDKWDAFQVLAQTGQACAGNVVGNNCCVAAKLPKWVVETT